MRQSQIHQALQITFALVCAATLANYSTGVDWSGSYKSHYMFAAVFMFCYAAIFGLAPYVLLWQLLRSGSRTWFKLLAFLLTVAPAPFLFFFWSDTEGWSFILVPVVQFFIVLPLLLLAGNLKYLTLPSVPT